MYRKYIYFIISYLIIANDFASTKKLKNNPLSETLKTNDEADTRKKIPIKNDNSDGDTQPTKNEAQDFVKPLYEKTVDPKKLTKGFDIPFQVTLKKEIAENEGLELEDTLKLGTQEDIAKLFSAVAEKENVKITVQEDITSSMLQTRSNQIVLVLKLVPAETEKNYFHTVLIIKLKQSNLIFEKEKYEVNTFAEYTGLVIQVNVKSYNDEPSYNIKYTISKIEGQPDAEKSLHIDDKKGILYVNTYMKPGNYKIDITAEVLGENLKATTTVTLSVVPVVVCDKNNLHFEYARLTKFIENSLDKDIDILKPIKEEEKCNYEILTQQPGNFFVVDSKTGIIKFKKDAKIEENKKLILDLGINCEANTPENVNSKKDDGKENSDSNIKYNPNLMQLVLEIESSKTPSLLPSNELFVGYPKEYTFILHNPPQLLATISANKINLDGKIVYSIEQNKCPFSINSETGNIYPLTYHSNDEDVKFTVLAKGTTNGKNVEGKQEVTVKFLSTMEIVEIFFVDATPENVNTILKDLGAEKDFILKGFSFAVVPVSDEEKEEHKDTFKKADVHLLRAFCYGFEKKDHSIMKAEVIKEKLNQSSKILYINTLEETKIGSGSPFLHALGIAAIILVVLFIPVFIYFLVSRRHQLPVLSFRRNNDKSSTTPLEDDMEGPSQTQWISSHVDEFGKFGKALNSSTFANAAFDNRRESFSNPIGELVIMDCRNNTEGGDSLGSAVTSFKPDLPQEANFNSNAFYSDLEITSNNEATSSVKTNDVPVLPVISLPPVNSERRRRIRVDTANTDNV